MAGRAGLSLTGGTYCAAVMRLHPQIDIDAIDGQTVEEARILQQAISAEIDARCAREVWSYKRSTLITLYIFDIKTRNPFCRSCGMWWNGSIAIIRWKPAGASVRLAPT